MTIFLIMGTFVVASCISYLANNRRITEVVSVMASIIAFVLSLYIAQEVALRGIYEPSAFFRIDALSGIVLMLVTLVGLASSFFSVFYLRDEIKKGEVKEEKTHMYFTLLMLFVGAMVFALSVSNPIMMWIGIEATTLSTAFLISFYNKASSVEGAWKYLIVNSVGLLFGFLGTLLYFTVLGAGNADTTVTWDTIAAGIQLMNPIIAQMAFIFVLIGFGTKVGFVPMHTWLPDAHGRAPAPVSALLSGVLLSVAFVAVLRFKLLTDLVVDKSFSNGLLIAFGLLSILVSALIIFAQKNYKRMLAYSSIENMGIMALGVGFGGAGVFAALLHLVYHSLVKSSLFYAAGNLLLTYGSAKIKNVHKALAKVPATAVVFVIGVLAVTGVPPFGTFLTKFGIISAGIGTYPYVVTVVLVCFSLVFIGFLKHTSEMIFGHKQSEEAVEAPMNVGLIIKPSKWLILPPVALLVIAFILSFYLPPLLVSLLTKAAAMF